MEAIQSILIFYVKFLKNLSNPHHYNNAFKERREIVSSAVSEKQYLARFHSLAVVDRSQFKAAN